MPQTLDDAALKALQGICPAMYTHFGGKDGKYCCASKQVNTLVTKLDLLHEIVLGCPACDNNFKHLYCYMTCAPYQIEFVNVTKSSKETFGSKRVVDDIDYYVAADFGQAVWDSCKEVKVSSMNTKAIDSLCKTTDCKGWHMMLSKQGEKFPLLNPINIHFPINTTQSLVPQGYYPQNDSLPTCYDQSYRCSCGDCPQGPRCVKPKPAPPPPPMGCVAVGLPGSSPFTCIDVSLWAAFAVIAFSSVLWVNMSKKKGGEGNKGLRNYADMMEPLLEEKGGPGAGLDGEADIMANVSIEEAIENAMADESNLLILPPVESFLRQWFYKQGVWISKFPGRTLLLTLIFVVVCLLGLLRFEVQTDPEKLWVPAGSKAKEEKDFFDKSFGKFYRIEQLIVQNSDPTSNSSIVSDENIRLMFDMQDIVGNISVPVIGGEGKNATLDSICFKPFGKEGNCATQSVLQYWQMDRNTFEFNAANHPNQTDWMEFCFQQWGTREECFSDFKAPMDPKLVFGGFPKNQGNVAYWNQSESLIVVYLVDNSEQNLDAAVAFEEEFIKTVQTRLVPMAEKRNLKISYSSESSIQFELERESNADAITVMLSFVAMFLYMTFVLGGANSCRPSLVCFRTRILLGLGGVLLVVLSILCAAGILSAFGMKTTLLIVEVIPFLALAIGVDNMCILAHTLQNQDTNSALSIRMGNALSSAGPSITLAASAEFLAFLAGVMTGMPACTTFALFAAFTVLIDYFFQVTAFVALLHLDELRIRQFRMDCFPCLKDCREQSLVYKKTSKGFFHRMITKFSKVLEGKHVQVAVLLGFTSLLFASIGGVQRLEFGLDQTVALPKDSYLQDYFHDIAVQLRVGPPVYFVQKNMNIHPTSEDVNKTCSTAGCFPNSMLTQIQNAALIAPSTYIATAAASWIDDYISWLNPSLNKCCRMYSNETFCPSLAKGDCETCFDGNSPDPLFHLHGRPTVPQFNKTLPWFMEAIPGKICAKAGRGAYNTELKQSTEDPTGYDGVSKGMVKAARYRGYHTPLSTQQDFIGALREAKELTHKISYDLGLDVFPYSVFYIFFEQYLQMYYYAAVTFSAAAIGILFVSYFFLGSLWAATLSVAVVMSIVIDIMGCMSALGIQFNAISLTNLAMAVGIGLEFCIHIVRAFTVADGTKTFRAQVALSSMGTPVFNGITLTKLVGVLVLSLAQTKIFQIYYFRMYLLLVIISTLHAFVLLPVLLMLVGPPRLPYALFMSEELESNYDEEQQSKSKA
jgi:Niemann-Pick C1 protein